RGLRSHVDHHAPIAHDRGMKAAWLIVALSAATAAADPRACPADERFDKSKDNHKGQADGLVGKTAAQVIAKRGQPGCKSATLWRYWMPNGCAYEKTVVSVWFANGKVVRANSVHHWTGEECMLSK